MQLLCGLPEIEVFRDGNEVANVTQFHGTVFYTRWVLLQKAVWFIAELTSSSAIRSAPAGTDFVSAALAVHAA